MQWSQARFGEDALTIFHNDDNFCIHCYYVIGVYAFTDTSFTVVCGRRRSTLSGQRVSDVRLSVCRLLVPPSPRCKRMSPSVRISCKARQSTSKSLSTPPTHSQSPSLTWHKYELQHAGVVCTLSRLCRAIRTYLCRPFISFQTLPTHSGRCHAPPCVRLTALSCSLAQARRLYDDSVTIPPTDPDACSGQTDCTYHIGVLAFTNTTFTIVAHFENATLLADGVSQNGHVDKEAIKYYEVSPLCPDKATVRCKHCTRACVH